MAHGLFDFLVETGRFSYKSLLYLIQSLASELLEQLCSSPLALDHWMVQLVVPGACWEDQLVIWGRSAKA